MLFPINSEELEPWHGDGVKVGAVVSVGVGAGVSVDVAVGTATMLQGNNSFGCLIAFLGYDLNHYVSRRFGKPCNLPLKLSGGTIIPVLALQL